MARHLEAALMDDAFRRNLAAEGEIDAIFDAQDAKYLKQIVELQDEIKRAEEEKKQAEEREKQAQEEKEKAQEREKQASGKRKGNPHQASSPAEILRRYPGRDPERDRPGS
jgi:TolA-binding protein